MIAMIIFMLNRLIENFLSFKPWGVRKRYLFALAIYAFIALIYISPFSWMPRKMNNESAAMYLSMVLSGFIIFMHLNNDYEANFEEDD